MRRPWVPWLQALASWPGVIEAFDKAVMKYPQNRTRFSPDEFVYLDFLPPYTQYWRAGGLSEPQIVDKAKEVMTQISVLLSAVVPFFAYGKVIIKPTADLIHQLANTVLTVPLSMVKPPFDSVYINLTEAGIMIRGEVVDGAYFYYDWGKFDVADITTEPPTLKHRPDLVGLRIVLSLRNPHGPDAMVSLPSFEKSDELVETEAEKLGKVVVHDMSNLNKPENDNIKDLFKFARICCGLCLYMSHPDLLANVSTKFHHQRDQALRDMKKERFTEAVKAHIHGHAESVIKVTCAKAPSEKRADGDSAPGSSVASHWRRGHWHLYWTGPGKTIPRANWIQPILVNPEKMTGKVKPKTYEVS